MRNSGPKNWRLKLSSYLLLIQQESIVFAPKKKARVILIISTSGVQLGKKSTLPSLIKLLVILLFYFLTIKIKSQGSSSDPSSSCLSLMKNLQWLPSLLDALNWRIKKKLSHFCLDQTSWLMLSKLRLQIMQSFSLDFRTDGTSNLIGTTNKNAATSSLSRTSLAMLAREFLLV